MSSLVTSQHAEELSTGARQLGVDLTPAQHELLLGYLALLIKWNKAYNLTAVRDPDEMVSRHLLDSLSVMPFIENGRWLDVGSGGGMPGIPLAIARPDLAFTLLDSNSKKTAFLQQAAIELALPNIAVHCGRVEQYHPASGFTAITSRAFAELADFVGLSAHLLIDGGVWLAMKGLWPHEEIARLPASVRVEAVHRLQLPGLADERHLVVLKTVA